MKTPLWKNTLLAMVLGAASLSAQAEWVETDWKVSGDAAATLHVESGVEWLDLNFTDGMSIADVVAQTTRGGQFAGWRLPTYDEIKFFMSEGVFSGLFTRSGAFASDAYRDEVATFYALFGETDPEPARRSYGMYVHDNGEVRIYGVRDDDTFKINEDHPVYANAGPYTDAYSNTGVWLVSDGGTTLSSIENPELNINNPAAPVNQVPVILGGIALFGLVVGRRRSAGASAR